MYTVAPMAIYLITPTQRFWAGMACWKQSGIVIVAAVQLFATATTIRTVAHGVAIVVVVVKKESVTVNNNCSGVCRHCGIIDRMLRFHQ